MSQRFYTDLMEITVGIMEMDYYGNKRIRDLNGKILCQYDTSTGRTYDYVHNNSAGSDCCEVFFKPISERKAKRILKRLR